MPGHSLHQLDAFLCRHARDNVCWNLDDSEIARRVDQLDPRLAAYVKAGHPDLGDVPPIGQFLLSEQEFDMLIEAASGLPSSIVHDVSGQPNRLWLSDTAFFQMTPMCTSEVRQYVAPSEAERWSQRCNALVQRLANGRLLLAQGLDTVRELAVLIRQYLAAMDEPSLIPPPRGSFPTPMNPLPSANSVEDQLDPTLKDAVQRMRGAIQQHENGAKATPAGLIKIARINKQVGRKALRILQELGEYDGHGRSTSD